MNLRTELNYKGSVISIIEDNNNSIICKSVKITNKRKQKAQNTRENIEEQFLKTASIDRKKIKKQNFFNKHKNN